MFAILIPAIVMAAASWDSPMRQARSGCRHFLLAQEVIGALREGFKDESSDEQGREKSAYYKKGASYGYIQ